MSVQAERDSTRDPVDAKAWFYLDHRADIEEWAALRGAGRDLVDRHLIALAADVEGLAAENGAKQYVHDLDPDGRFPRVGLGRATWQHGGHQDVTVVLEWERTALLVPKSSNPWPYVAVRVARRQEDVVRRQAVFDAVAGLRREIGFSPSRKVTGQWPMWRYVKIPSTPGIDPSALAEASLNALQELWQRAAPLLDELHTTHMSAASRPGPTQPER